MVAEAETDETGHYLLAIEDQYIQALQNTPERKRSRLIDRVARFVSTPAGAYRPLPMARRFHQSAARNRYCIGGNRSSKSHALVHEVFWRLTATHPWQDCKRSILAWYATLSFELVGEVLWPKMEVLLRGWDYDPVWISRGQNIPRSVTIRLSDGKVSKLTYKAYEQGRETFQSAELDVAAFDEQFPQDIYVETTSRLGADRSLLFMAAFTPIVPQPWLEQKLTLDRPVDTEVFEFPLDDNRISRGGFIEDDEIDAAIAEWPQEVVETRRNGKWGSYLGAIFQTFSVTTHVVKEGDEGNFLTGRWNDQPSIPPDLNPVGSIDWGGANPFVFLWGLKLPHLDGAWYIYDEYYHDSRAKGQKRLADHAEVIKIRTRDRWRTVLKKTWADHDPTDAHEMAQYGLPSSPARKDVIAGIELVQTLLKVRQDTNRPRLFIAARCQNLIREITGYRWSEATDAKNAREEPVKKDDHTVDALRYLVYSEEKRIGPNSMKDLLSLMGN